MTKYILVGLIIFLTSCHNKTDEVVVTEYGWDKSIRSKGIFTSEIQITDSLTKYRITGDTSSIFLWFPFNKPTKTDSIVYSGDMIMKLTAKKIYKFDRIESKVLRYQYKDGMDGDITLFLEKAYGPILVRSDSC
ncbi:MAG: hypothetical protein EBR30_14530 [Cytophagia bacterium]|nr:hypothetical protein [Cytophagia bacterium]